MRVSRSGWRMAVVAAAIGVLTACGAEAPEPVDPSPSPSGSPRTASPAPNPSPTTVTVPADGVALGGFGYRNGPVREFSLPRSTTITVVVDQPNNVTAVMSQPSAGDLFSYLSSALPAGGFVVTASDAADSTLTFTGHGWSGSFTGDAQASAVLLRPS